MDTILVDSVAEVVEDERQKTTDDLDTAIRNARKEDFLPVSQLRDPRTEGAALELDRYKKLVTDWRTALTLIEHFWLNDAAGKAAFNVAASRAKDSDESGRQATVKRKR